MRSSRRARQACPALLLSALDGRTLYGGHHVFEHGLFLEIEDLAGDILQYDVEVDGQTLSVELATRGRESILAPGAEVCVSFRPEDAFVFGAAP